MMDNQTRFFGNAEKTAQTLSELVEAAQSENPLGCDFGRALMHWDGVAFRDSIDPSILLEAFLAAEAEDVPSEWIIHVSRLKGELESISQEQDKIKLELTALRDKHRRRSTWMI